MRWKIFNIITGPEEESGKERELIARHDEKSSKEEFEEDYRKNFNCDPLYISDKQAEQDPEQNLHTKARLNTED